MVFFLILLLLPLIITSYVADENELNVENLSLVRLAELRVSIFSSRKNNILLSLIFINESFQIIEYSRYRNNCNRLIYFREKNKILLTDGKPLFGRCSYKRCSLKHYFEISKIKFMLHFKVLALYMIIIRKMSFVLCENHFEPTKE